jgi:glycosyltransferase involved in cell wall biosynthesis
MLARVLPEISRRDVALTVRGRVVRDPEAFGETAEQIAWGADEAPPSAAAAAEVAKTIEDVRPDAVFLSNIFDIGVVRAARTAPRAIAHLHDHRSFCPHGDRIYPQFRALCSNPMGTACIVNSVLHGCVEGPRPATLRRLRAREVLKDALLALDGINVGSQFMAGLCVRNGVAPDRVNALAPPVDPLSLATPPEPMPRERRLLFAGRLVRDKGFESLVRAISRIPEDERPVLDVAGAPTPDSDAVAAGAEAMGVRLSLLGRQDRAAFAATLDRARAVAVPSVWPEPFGMMGIEAYARGRPVAAYAVGGIPEWIGDAGIAVPRGDEAALARAIVEVLDESRWKDLSSAARIQASRYTPEAYVDRLLPILFPLQ